MSTVILVIHLMVAAALVAVVLLQRSEGGALGIGGGGGGGFLTGRGTANFLTRVTAGLAAAFFTTSVILSILANPGAAPPSMLDSVVPTNGTQQQPAPTERRGGVLDKLGGGKSAPAAPAVPQTR